MARDNENFEGSSPLKKRCLWKGEGEHSSPSPQKAKLPPMPQENAWPEKPDGPEPEPRLWKEPIYTDTEQATDVQ